MFGLGSEEEVGQKNESSGALLVSRTGWKSSKDESLRVAPNFEKFRDKFFFMMSTAK